MLRSEKPVSNAKGDEGRKAVAYWPVSMKSKMRKKPILVFLMLAASLDTYLMFFSLDRQITLEHRLGAQLVLSETVHVDRRAYTSAWFGGDTLYLPVPASASHVIRQRGDHRLEEDP